MFNLSELKKEAYQILGNDTPGDKAIGEMEKSRLIEICAYLTKLNISEFEIRMLYYTISSTADRVSAGEKDFYSEFADKFYYTYLINAAQKIVQTNLLQKTDLQEQEISKLEEISQVVLSLGWDETINHLISLFSKASAINTHAKNKYQQLVSIFSEDEPLIEPQGRTLISFTA